MKNTIALVAASAFLVACQKPEVEVIDLPQEISVEVPAEAPVEEVLEVPAEAPAETLTEEVPS